MTGVSDRGSADNDFNEDTACIACMVRTGLAHSILYWCIAAFPLLEHLNIYLLHRASKGGPRQDEHVSNNGWVNAKYSSRTVVCVYRICRGYMIYIYIYRSHTHTHTDGSKNVVMRLCMFLFPHLLFLSSTVYRYQPANICSTIRSPNCGGVFSFS